MATNTFYLRIVSAKKVFFSGRCISIIVPVADGQEEILAHHENIGQCSRKRRIEIQT